jgi:DNA-binding beta-propeller fold protein YncE
VTGYVYAAGNSVVAVISETQIITLLSTLSSGTSMGVDPTTGYVYMASEYGDDVTVIAGLGMVGTVAVGVDPIAVGVNPVSRLVYVANHLGQSISIIGDVLPFKAFLPVVLKNG